MDERVKILARNLVKNSCEIKPGEKVWINQIGNAAEDIVKALIREVYAAGGVPFVHYENPRIQRELLKNCTEEQIKMMAERDCREMEQMDAFIGVRASDNSTELSDVPAEKMEMYEKLYGEPVHYGIRIPKTKWVVLRFPTPSMAQQSNMSFEAFEDFYYDVCNLDYSKMEKASNALVDLMNRTDKVRMTGKGTDITFSIKDIPAVSCCGHMNIPDGEVYTAPVRDSVNGIISYNTPTVLQGFTYESVCLEFENGKIRYSLLPVWMLNIKYKDQMYKFAINGQTGKVVGEYPVDKNKKWKYFWKVAGVCYVVAAAIGWMLLH